MTITSSLIGGGDGGVAGTAGAAAAPAPGVAAGGDKVGRVTNGCVGVGALRLLGTLVVPGGVIDGAYRGGEYIDAGGDVGTGATLGAEYEPLLPE